MVKRYRGQTAVVKRYRGQTAVVKRYRGQTAVVNYTFGYRLVMAHLVLFCNLSHSFVSNKHTDIHTYIHNGGLLDMRTIIKVTRLIIPHTLRQPFLGCIGL